MALKDHIFHILPLSDPANLFEVLENRKLRTCNIAQKCKSKQIIERAPLFLNYKQSTLPPVDLEAYNFYCC